jgi:hypothetical protein
MHHGLGGGGRHLAFAGQLLTRGGEHTARAGLLPPPCPLLLTHPLRPTSVKNHSFVGVLGGLASGSTATLCCTACFCSGALAAQRLR